MIIAQKNAEVKEENMLVEKQGNFFGIDGIVPGSAEEIAKRKSDQEAREGKRLIDEMSDEFPQLGRIFEMISNGGAK